MFHVIPLNDQIVHYTNEDCPCSPFDDGEGSMVHHALDGRERLERAGIPIGTGLGWVIVGDKPKEKRDE